MKYNYFLINMTGQFNDYAYGKEIAELNYAYYESSFPTNKFFNFLMRIHLSNKINSIVNLPYKSFWCFKRVKFYKKQIKYMQNQNLPICFVLFSDCLALEKYGFSEILKKEFPNSKIVYYFQDLVDLDKRKKELVENIPSYIDAVFSFDGKEAEKYNLHFHNISYSLPHYDKNRVPKYDVFFLGAAKNRLPEIIDAYEVLKKQNIKCLFFIIGVDKADRKYEDEINYCNFVSYGDYLEYLQDSKCVLEIMQKNGTGNTIRTNEVIAYDKLLLSNNQSLLKNSLYDSEYMKVFDDLSLIDIKFFLQKYPLEYKNKERMLPSQFFKDIEVVLEGK